MSEYHLSVVQPFAEHASGDRITDADKIKAILESEQSQHVVRVAAVAPSAPAVEETGV